MRLFVAVHGDSWRKTEGEALFHQDNPISNNKNYCYQIEPFISSMTLLGKVKIIVEITLIS
jgi:hypothetical protein